MSRVVLQIILIVLSSWIALSFLVLPLLMLLGRAGYRADVDAVRHHQEMVSAEPAAALAPAEQAHVFHA